MTQKNSEARRVFDPEELEALIPDLLLMEAWIGAVKAQIQELVEGGVKMDLARLEPKRATRKWILTDEEVIKKLQGVFKALGKKSDTDAVAPRKVLSPAEAEKVTGKPNFADLLADKTKAESSGFNLKLG